MASSWGSWYGNVHPATTQRTLVPLSALNCWQRFPGPDHQAGPYYLPQPKPTPSVDVNSPPYLQSWWRKDSNEVSDAIRSALNHQVELENALQEIKRLQGAGSETSATQSVTKPVLQALEVSSQGLREFINSIAHPQFFNERSITHGEDRVAQKVFEIPELLENILLHHSNMRDILNMRQVSRTVQANIKGSPKLQRSTFLLPQPHSALQLPSLLLNAPGFAIGIEQRIDLPRKVPTFQDMMDFATYRKLTIYKLNAKFRTGHPHKLPIVGKALQATFLCQPPIKEIGYQFKCCGSEDGSLDGMMEAPEGLTVGHLYEKTKEIYDAHALCPFAPASYLDDEGFVDLEVYFSGELQLLEHDPLFHADYSNVHAFMRPVKPCPIGTTASHRLIDYSNAKAAAHMEGEPVPTLAEYEAMIAYESGQFLTPT